jgi:hypothetical protein
MLGSDGMMGSLVMGGREQQPAFKILEARVKLDASAFGFPNDSIEDSRARHWPLLGKSVRRKLWS